MPIDTNMLMYMLAGPAAALSPEGSAGQAIGQMTQGAIQTQNYSKMLQAMLAGGGKMNMDKENMSFKVPTGFFKGKEDEVSKLGIQRPDFANLPGGGGGGVPAPAAQPALPASNVGVRMSPQGGQYNPFLMLSQISVV